jgi:hypothetical protein
MEQKDKTLCIIRGIIQRYLYKWLGNIVIAGEGIIVNISSHAAKDIKRLW